MSKERYLQQDTEMLGRSIDNLEGRFLVLANKKDPGFIRALINTRDTLREEREDTVTRPLICAAYVARGIGGGIDRLVYKPRDPRLISSIEFGLMAVGDSVRVAQRYLDGKTDEDILKVKSDVGDELFKRLGIYHRQDVQIASLLRPRALAKEASDRLVQDPSGFLVVDWTLQHHQTNNKELIDAMFPAPAIVYKAMNFGIGMYKALYPLTEGLV